MALEIWLFPIGIPLKKGILRGWASAVHVQSGLVNVKRESEDITGPDLLHKFLIDRLN